MPRPAARNVLGDLEAIVRLPGLREIADVLAMFDPSRSRIDHLSLVVYVVGRWRVGSARELDSLLARRGQWPKLCGAALSAGYQLGTIAPTYDAFYNLRRRVDSRGDGAFRDMLAALKETFTAVAVPQANALGMLQPRALDLDDLRRENALVADGSNFLTASEVHVDEHGEVVGSRADSTNPASTGPRVVEHRLDKDRRPGAPVELVSVRGDRPNERVIVAVEEILGGDETEAARQSIRRVIAEAAGGVHVVAYDRLLAGADIDALMRLGVLPVVGMKQASKKAGGLEISYEEACRRPRRRGSEPKTRLVKRYITEVAHPTADGRDCEHQLWGLDGAAVFVPKGEHVSLRARESLLSGVALRPALADDVLLEGHYAYDCSGRTHHALVELTGNAKTGSGRDTPIANALRPIPEVDPRFARVNGWRQDAESVYSTIKRRLNLDGRAPSYDLDHFTLDVIGAALLVNAVSWDLYGAGQVVAG